MREIVKFDVTGQRRLEFDADSVSYLTNELYPAPLLALIITFFLRLCGKTVKCPAIPYRDVRSIAPVRRRETWALVTAVLGGSLGLYLMILSLGDWGALAFSAVLFLLLGALPLWIFLRGRTYLAITSETNAIRFPMDRKKKQVQRAIALLKEHCPVESVRWEV